MNRINLYTALLIAMFALMACNSLSVPVVPSTTAPTVNGSCPPPPRVQETQPSFPVKITMAEGTTGDAKDPANPTTTFKSNSTFHAVLRIENAPASSKFGAVWFALDTGGIAPCNSPIDATTLESDGTRNLDFALAPTGNWPAGTYQVQIVVNGKVARVQTFNVK